MSSQEIFDSGYALRMYDVNHDRFTFRFREETIPVSGIRMVGIEGKQHPLYGLIYRIEDVRKAAM